MDWGANGNLRRWDGKANYRVVAKESQTPGCMGELASFLKTDQPISWCDVNETVPDGDGNFTEEIEVGWHLAQMHWGNGYATEGGRKMIELGFAVQNLEQIYAVTGPDNLKSQKVARRLGMKPQGQTDKYYGQTVDLFKITIDEWSARRVEQIKTS